MKTDTQTRIAAICIIILLVMICVKACSGAEAPMTWTIKLETNIINKCEWHHMRLLVNVASNISGVILVNNATDIRLVAHHDYGYIPFGKTHPWLKFTNGYEKLVVLTNPIVSYPQTIFVCDMTNYFAMPENQCGFWWISMRYWND